MLVNAARRLSVVPWIKRAGVTLGAAGLCFLAAGNSLQVAVANGDTRTLSFFHLHTKESITVTFKRNGRYDEAGLKQLNWFLRDWRRDAQIRMEPHLFDLLWETYREVGGSQPIEIISAYRSPETNSMLRARSSGVAQTSQHTQGQAIDFHIPGVPLEKVRNVGLRMQRGGVGFYPTSGSPFIHMDVGSVRHWPRLTHDQLAKVFPDGRTVHIPSDGQPLAGYALAMADLERRGGSRPSGVSLAAARDAGVITTASLETAQQPRRGLLEGLFGGLNANNTIDEASEEPAAAPPARPRAPAAPVAVASIAPPKPITVAMAAPMPAAAPAPKPVAVEPTVPMPSARPKLPPAPVAVAAVLPQAKPALPAVMSAALPANLFQSRGYWQGAVNAGVLYGTAEQPFQVASADPSAPIALGYAADAEPARPARARPMGAAGAPVAREATVTQIPAASTTVAQKSSPMMSGAQRTDSPWLRAAMLTPSVSGYMTATRLGEVDMRPLQDMLHKPRDVLLMSFSADPHLGLVANAFTGSAVVFLATATFTAQTTASLR
ncbi:MAG: DUF882 domain-containing protein [Pseudolabrys sp.]|nr:DUF882 domain-containing protein [Pseudolabrys sp.]